MAENSRGQRQTPPEKRGSDLPGAARAGSKGGAHVKASLQGIRPTALNIVAMQAPASL